ncbi:hypothetical protein ACU8MT_09085 [Rhizobium leguminosarum]
MAVTVKAVVEAFEFFFDSLHKREFRKTLPLHQMKERDLLPLVRTFLLGYFWEVAPETRSSLPGSLTGQGSIDFVVGNVAVEFAVRRPTDSKRYLSDVHNATEIKKLLKHDGLAVLVLFDFSRSPFDEDDIERYREWPSLGRGNHKVSAFNVAYFYRDRFETKSITKNIRV